MEMHRFPEAKSQYEKTIASDPHFPPAHWKLSTLYAAQKDFASAVDQIVQWNGLSLSTAAAHDGATYLKLVMSKQPEEEWTPAVAGAYAALGDKDKAFEYLEKAYASRSIELTLEIRYPWFDPIRSDPRYADLMKRMGLPK